MEETLRADSIKKRLSMQTRVSDGNGVPYHMDSSKHSVKAGIPAQSYETDILPRYKEALSLGLASYRNHLKNTNKNYSTSSIFRIGSGPLPHIIGSEEYIHDNSCGLTEDLAPGTSSLDFSYLLEPREVCSDTEQHDMLWMQQGVSEKYACSMGINCNPIKEGGPCFYPDSRVSHSSVAMNLYYKSSGANTWNCYFNGTGLIVITDPSYGSCKYA